MNNWTSRLAVVSVLVLTSAAFAMEESSHLARIRYTADGKIPVPDYSKWVFIGSGAFDSAETAPAPRFSNVFVAPLVYDEYIRTGTWPDQTVIFSEKRS